MSTDTCFVCSNEDETVKSVCSTCIEEQCSKCEKTVTNSLLAYCQQLMGSCNVEEMSNAIYTHFNETMISEARQLLRDKCADLLQGHIIMTVASRRATGTRPVAEANAKDIAQAMYDIRDKDGVPIFTVKDLKDLPVIKPSTVDIQLETNQRLLMLENMVRRMCERTQNTEDLTSECLNRVGIYQSQTDRLVYNVQEMRTTLDTHGRIVNEVRSQTAAIIQQQMQSRPAYSHVTQMQPQPNLSPPPRQLNPQTPQMQRAPARMPPPMSPAVTQAPLQQIAAPHYAPAQTVAPTRPGFATPPGIPPSGASNVSGGQPPANNQQQQQPRLDSAPRNDWKQQGRRRRAPGLKGTVEGTHFKAGPSPNRDLWIFNVDQSIGDDDLKEYIAKGGNKQEKQIQIRKWEPRYQPHYSSKRFRLTIGLEDYQTVYDAEFWPKDIGVRKYWVDPNEDN
jgi:hypothetical protein